MESNLLKKILVQYVLPMMISMGILLVFFYFQYVIPLVSDLENRTDIVSVQIIQGNETVLLTDSKRIFSKLFCLPKRFIIGLEKQKAVKQM
ncbi:MAG TPA: hypothetical protein VIK77_08425 [Tissierellaceae bacterium]